MSQAPGKGQRITFSAAGTTVAANSTSWKRLDVDSGANVPTGQPAGGDQFIRVLCTSTDTGAAGALLLVLADPDSDNSSGDAGILYQETATVTVTTRRGDYDNGGGKYVCDVAFAKSAREYADLAGHCTRSGASGPKWYLGCTSLGGLTALQVVVHAGRAI